MDVSSRWEGQAEEASAGVEEPGADQALGEAVGGVLKRRALARFDGAAHYPPAQHGVAHSHPARPLGEAFAGGAVEDGLGVEVEGRRARRDHADVERDGRGREWAWAGRGGV